jgi:hypothetical protein
LKKGKENKQYISISHISYGSAPPDLNKTELAVPDNEFTSLQCPAVNVTVYRLFGSMCYV